MQCIIRSYVEYIYKFILRIIPSYNLRTYVPTSQRPTEREAIVLTIRIMHTVWVRLNAVVFFGLSVLLGLSLLAALSKLAHAPKPGTYVCMHISMCMIRGT